MLLLIDGYNLMFQSIASKSGVTGKNALRMARGRLMQLVVELIEESMRPSTMIVFDAKEAPPGVPDKYLWQGMQIVFARDWDSADELIQTEIRKHSAPKSLTVVSSDHAIHRKALARGATVLDCDKWLDEQFELRERRQRDAEQETDPLPIDAKQRSLSDKEKEDWLREFGF